MRATLSALALTVGLGTAPALAQMPPGLLQQLLPGNGQAQNPEQAIREAYERGYRAGRQDQERADQGRRPPPPPGPPGSQRYDQDPNQYQRNQYGR